MANNKQQIFTLKNSLNYSLPPSPISPFHSHFHPPPSYSSSTTPVHPYYYQHYSRYPYSVIQQNPKYNYKINYFYNYNNRNFHPLSPPVNYHQKNCFIINILKNFFLLIYHKIINNIHFNENLSFDEFLGIPQSLECLKIFYK